MIKGFSKHKITAVEAGSPLSGLVSAGDFLVSVDGQDVVDVLDYRYLIQDSEKVLIQKKDGARIEVKTGGRDIGCDFETGIMDKAMPCLNDCIFCFVAQNPPDLRETLYFRDDDWRLSFLTGNYITMTNMSDRDFERLVFYHLSPMNISVHAISPEVRRGMLRNKEAGSLLSRLEYLKKHGIGMNFQIVLCKGYNDGQELIETVTKLSAFMPLAQSLSVVPVGLTRYRETLTKLEPFNKSDAEWVVRMVEDLNADIIKRNGKAFCFAADEFYIKAGKPIPDYDYYEDFPQLENGVGMTALFYNEFMEALSYENDAGAAPGTAVITGEAAYDFIKNLTSYVPGTYIIKVRNGFFGESVTVSGLLSGKDIIEAIIGTTKNAKEHKENLVNIQRVLIPKNCLRADEDVFLDDLDIAAVSRETGVDFIAVEVNGAAFLHALIDRGEQHE